MSDTVRTDMIRSSGRPFIIVPVDFIDNAVDLSGQARWLYVLLTRLVNSEQNVAFPSYDYIQKNGLGPGDHQANPKPTDRKRLDFRRKAGWGSEPLHRTCSGYSGGSG
jgi:hypothetical protein